MSKICTGCRRGGPESPDHPLRTNVMDENWSGHYMNCETFHGLWDAVHEEGTAWPKGVQIMGDKIHLNGKLCVPQGLVDRVLQEFHKASGHIGVERMHKEMAHRYEFPMGEPIKEKTTQMRRGCKVCQACEPPYWSSKGPIEAHPVPERVMASVCLDVFAMPSTTWEEQEYDCIFLCVDRLSGWIVACPTTKLGLTAENAAHLILDNGWGPFGVPSSITSDQGAQFVGQWWRTMCARLGIRQCYSQPHRPQANGRAERAGRQLLTLLQKIHHEDGINWVEALPRALRLHHDMMGELGMSPYQILFGRDRSVTGLPYTPMRECEAATQYFTRMELLDLTLSKKLNGLHA